MKWTSASISENTDASSSIRVRSDRETVFRFYFFPVRKKCFEVCRCSDWKLVVRVYFSYSSWLSRDTQGDRGTNDPFLRNLYILLWPSIALVAELHCIDLEIFSKQRALIYIFGNVFNIQMGNYQHSSFRAKVWVGCVISRLTCWFKPFKFFSDNEWVVLCQCLSQWVEIW